MIWWWNVTHPFDLPQRSTCRLWTPRRRCWTRRLRLEFRKRGRGHLGSIKCRQCREERRDLLPRGTPETAAIPFISSPNGCGRVSAISGCRQKRTECTDAFQPSRTAKTKAQRRKATYQGKVHQLDQPPTGHKSICQVSDGLDHADQLQGKKKTERRCSGSDFVLNVDWNTETLAYLGFFVTDHSCPPLAGRQIEIHGVPTDGSFKPEAGEKSWAGLYKFGNRLLLPGTSDSLLIISSNWFCSRKKMGDLHLYFGKVLSEIFDWHRLIAL